MMEEQLTEAQQVAKRERKARPRYPSDKGPRLGTNINWNHNNDQDLFYCAAFKRMRHGDGKLVLIRFMEMLIPHDCRDVDEAERLMLAFLRARDPDARAQLLGAPQATYTPRITLDETRAQRRRKRPPTPPRPRMEPPAGMQWALIEDRRVRQEELRGEGDVELEDIEEEDAPEWEQAEEQPMSRQHPAPAETPPPEVVQHRRPTQTSMSLMGGRR